MNIINLRRNIRRSGDSRPNSDRRSADSQPESAATEGNSAFAKMNRRKSERRQQDRRKSLSEGQESNNYLQPGEKYARFKLTHGERDLIQDMFLSDLGEK